eukprot:6465883-Amphidinium_carterae.1
MDTIWHHINEFAWVPYEHWAVVAVSAEGAGVRRALGSPPALRGPPGGGRALPSCLRCET